MSPVKSFFSHAFAMSPPDINLPSIPPGLQPTTSPGSKPAAKGQQQSFMSGAAMAQQSLAGAGSGGTRGKSLIGA